MASADLFSAELSPRKPLDLSSKDVQERLSPAALKAFLKMCELWTVLDEDARPLLGGGSNGAFYEMTGKPRGRLDQDRLSLISLLTGIFKALNVLYGKKRPDQWIQLPNENAMFAGTTPRACMIMGGQRALLRVR
jgi:hypothetical protein